MTERLHFHFSLSCIGEGNGNPLQCSCLENPRDGGAWWAAIHGVAQSQTRMKWLSSSRRDILSVTSGNNVASSGYRPGMLLNILLYMQEIIITPRISAVPRLWNLGLGLIWWHCWGITILRTLPNSLSVRKFFCCVWWKQTIPGPMLGCFH